MTQQINTWCLRSINKYELRVINRVTINLKQEISKQWITDVFAINFVTQFGTKTFFCLKINTFIATFSVNFTFEDFFGDRPFLNINNTFVIQCHHILRN